MNTKEHNLGELEEWVDDDWYPAIYSAHLQLEKLDPNYKITQIKVKFNEIRYYYHQSVTDLTIFNEMEKVIQNLEKEIAFSEYKTGIIIKLPLPEEENNSSYRIETLVEVIILSLKLKHIKTTWYKNEMEWLLGSHEEQKTITKKIKKQTKLIKEINYQIFVKKVINTPKTSKP